MRIYRLEDDFSEPIRWYLNVPTGTDGLDLTWSFNTSKSYGQIAPLFTGIQQNGRRVDFTLGAFDIPILNRTAMSIFQTFAGDCVEFIPTKVEGERDDYFI